MQFIEEYKKKKRIKLSDDDLYDIVLSDRDEAERYFKANIAEEIILRYNLLHSNKDYYAAKFPKLSELSSFSASDVKDVVEWLMPSFTEVYFGADKVVGIFGRTPDDNPESLERVMKYQLQNQNNGYVLIDQWVRDAVEAGLGVIRLDWERREKPVLNWYQATAEEFYSIPAEEAEKMIKKVEALPDGTYKLLIKEKKVTKNQPVIRNVRPGEYIFIPDENEDGKNVFECHRRTMLYDDIKRLGKQKVYKNTENFDFVDPDGGDGDCMTAVYDAIRNYVGDSERRNELLDASSKDGQEGRKLVVAYDCYGYYDVDGDGFLEPVHAVISNGRLLMAEISEEERSPFFGISFYARSYQKWKEGVADSLQDIQDVKTALIKQIIINTAINNDRSFAIDANQTTAISDIQAGKKLARVDLQNGRGVGDFLQPMPKFDIPKEAFALMELASSWSEQRTGITKYNQGLDSDSLNKTATGISKIMAASQQRLRKMARDGAENGLVPMYRHLIHLNKLHLDKEFYFRLTNEYFEFKPDDVRGEFDVQVTSNIGLQDKQLTVQNLMLMFTQILPPLIQMGAASPAGFYQTALQIIEEMGFTTPDKYVGMEQGAAITASATNNIVQALPDMMMQIGQQAGLDPQVAGAIAQQLAANIQQVSAASQQQAQQIVQDPQHAKAAIENAQPDGRMPR